MALALPLACAIAESPSCNHTRRFIAEDRKPSGKTLTPVQLGTSDQALNALYGLYTEQRLDLAVFLFADDSFYATDVEHGELQRDPQRIRQFIADTGLSGRIRE